MKLLVCVTILLVIAVTVDARASRKAKAKAAADAASGCNQAAAEPAKRAPRRRVARTRAQRPKRVKPVRKTVSWTDSQYQGPPAPGPPPAVPQSSHQGAAAAPENSQIFYIIDSSQLDYGSSAHAVAQHPVETHYSLVPQGYAPLAAEHERASAAQTYHIVQGRK